MTFPLVILNTFEPFGVKYLSSNSHPLNDLESSNHLKTTERDQKDKQLLSSLLLTSSTSSSNQQKKKTNSSSTTDPSASFDFNQFKRDRNHHPSDLFSLVKTTDHVEKEDEEDALTETKLNNYTLFNGCSAESLHGSAASFTSTASKLHPKDGETVLTSWETRDEEVSIFICI